MPYTVIMHIMNEDPFVAEIEDLPDPNSNCVAVSNPRKRDGKPVHYLDREATTVYYPWSRITFLEVLAPRRSRDDVVEFFRD